MCESKVRSGPRSIESILEDILAELRTANELAAQDAKRGRGEGPIYTATQAAKILGVSRQTLLRWAKDGLLKQARIGGRVGYSKEDLVGIHQDRG